VITLANKIEIKEFVGHTPKATNQQSEKTAVNNIKKQQVAKNKNTRNKNK
jgi:hypothetical protein